MRPFRRKPTKTPFGRTLLAINDLWVEAFAAAPQLDHEHGVVLRSASAGATVALGGYGAYLREEFKDASPTVGEPTVLSDHIAEFAHALNDAAAVEAAYRVVTWAVVADFAAFFWRPNYDIEMNECASVFGFHNIYEQTVANLGSPISKNASDDERGERRYDLVKGSLYCMIGAAIDVPVEPENIVINLHVPSWIEQFTEAESVAKERLDQLAPSGLPIWDD